jgi:uncharacterized delta-60 repeat protein
MSKFQPGKSLFTLTPTGLVRLFTWAALVLAGTLAFAQAGQLDPNFGNNGIFATTFNGQAPVFGTSIALQADGKLIVGGEAGNPGVVLRLNTNGTLDTTFASHGVFSIRFSDVQNITIGVAVQPTQKILAVGTGLPGRGQLIRLNSDGSQDTTFGNGGAVVLQVTPRVLAVQPDGKIIITGGGGNGGPVLSMTRYTADGQVDTTFGSGGTAPLIGGDGSVAFQSDGKILVGSGTGDFFFGQTPGSLVRYKTDGSLDSVFGINGQVAALSGAAALAVVSNGQIVTGGATTSSASLSGLVVGFGLTEFFPTGTLTFLFGTHGGSIAPFQGFATAVISSLALQPNSFIVAGGTAGSAPVSVFALARYLPTGQLDTSFGTGGKVTTSFGNTTSSISAIALQSDGKIVAVGTAGGDLVVARYLGQ